MASCFGCLASIASRISVKWVLKQICDNLKISSIEKVESFSDGKSRRNSFLGIKPFRYFKSNSCVLMTSESDELVLLEGDNVVVGEENIRSFFHRNVIKNIYFQDVFLIRRIEGLELYKVRFVTVRNFEVVGGLVLKCYHDVVTKRLIARRVMIDGKDSSF